MKSSLLDAAVASSTFAPMEVPDRTNCLEIVRPEMLDGNSSVNLTIRREKSKVLIQMSIGFVSAIF
jgi:hypothetical protein